MTRLEFRKPKFLGSLVANLPHPLRLICTGSRIPLTNIAYHAYMEEGPCRWWVDTHREGPWGGGRAHLGRLYVVWDYLAPMEAEAI